MKTISIVNNKGGTGKTTLSINLSYGLVEKGYKVLLVCMDTQDNTNITSINNEYEYSIADVLLNKCKIKDSVIESPIGYDYIPSSDNLISFEQSKDKDSWKLKKSLDQLKDSYDYIVIDTPPSINLSLINALVSSNIVLISSESDIYSVSGIKSLLTNISVLRKAYKLSYDHIGIVINRYRETIYSKTVLEEIQELAEDNGISLFNTKIRDSVKVKESEYLRDSVISYAPRTPIAQDFRELTGEIINLEQR